MKVALFGGAFNPPHFGHLLIARQVLDFTDTDEVWFLPNFGQLPPKPDVAGVTDRLAMTRFLSMPGTRVSTLEIDHQTDGNTINLLPFLPGGNTYKFVIGSDWLPGFKSWGRWQELLTKLPFLIFPRAGFPNEPLLPGMQLLQHKLLIITDLSATKIRERIKAGLTIDQFVPEKVDRYIKVHGLYR